jgi:hypothetical protein
MLGFLQSPSSRNHSVEEDPMATNGATSTSSSFDHMPAMQKQHMNSFSSSSSTSSPSDSPRVPGRNVQEMESSEKVGVSFLRSVLSPSPTVPYLCHNPGTAPTVAPTPTPSRISHPTTSTTRGKGANGASSCFEDVQQGFLDPRARVAHRPTTPKALFSSSNSHNHNSMSVHSDSSTEDLPRMMMMASPTPNLPHPAWHHKSRRKSRSFRRSSSSSGHRSSSSLSHSLLLDGYDDGGSAAVNNHGSMSGPLAVRRRSSQREIRRSDSVNQLSLNSESHRHSCRHNESSSLETSESSPDSSPNRTMTDIHLQQHPQQDPTKQQWRRTVGSFSSTSRLSGNASDMSNSLNSHQSIGGNSFTSLVGLHKKWSAKSYCLTGSFIGMILLSLMGMVFLTNRVSFEGVHDFEEQYINRPDSFPSAAGLRGKMVQGHWDDKPVKQNSSSSGATNGNSISSKVTKVPPPSSNKPTTSGKQPKQPDEKKEIPKQEKKTSTTPPKPKISSAKHAFAMPTTMKIHMPPPMTFPEVNFEMTYPNLYGIESMAKVLSPSDTSNQQHAPRVVMVDPSLPVMERKIKLYPADFTDNTQLYGVLSSDDERLSRMEIRAPYSKGECVPMQEWQTTFHPSCNGMHELALDTIGAVSDSDSKERGSTALAFAKLLGGLDAQLFGTKGFWRYAWKLTMDNYNSPKVSKDMIVLKTLK